MHRVKVWVSSHPYLTGFLVLAAVVLFIIIRRAGSSISVSQPVNSGVSGAYLQAQEQKTALDAASNQQGAALAAALAAKQIDASTALQIAGAQRDVALFGIGKSAEVAEGQTAAGLASVQTQVGGQIQIAGLSVARDIQLATIQAPILSEQIKAALASQKDIDATSLAIYGIQAQRDVTLGGQQVDIAGINANRDITINGQNTGAAVDIAGLEAGVLTHQIDSSAFTQNHYLDIVHDLNAADLNYHKNTIDQLIASLNFGVFNKGGEGGANQVAIITTALGDPRAGIAAEGNQNVPGNTLGGIFAGLGSMFAGVGTGLLGGAKLAAAV